MCDAKKNVSGHSAKLCCCCLLFFSFSLSLSQKEWQKVCIKSSSSGGPHANFCVFNVWGQNFSHTPKRLVKSPTENKFCFRSLHQPRVMRPASTGAVNMAANNSAPLQLSNGYRTCPWEMDLHALLSPVDLCTRLRCLCVRARVCARACVITFSSLDKTFLCPWRIPAQWCPYLLGNNCNTWKAEIGPSSLLPSNRGWLAAQGCGGGKKRASTNHEQKSPSHRTVNAERMLGIRR